MLLPAPEQNILDRRDEIVAALKSMLPKGMCDR